MNAILQNEAKDPGCKTLKFDLTKPNMTEMSILSFVFNFESTIRNVITKEQ